MRIIFFLKNWALPISIMSGIAGYFLYVNIPCLAPTHTFVLKCVEYIQPILIFFMLFLTFCRIKPSELRPHLWQLWLMLIQIVLFGALSLFLHFFPDTQWRLVTEGAMLCLICPTATAAAVVTLKLGGSGAAITTYTIIINLAVALLAPLFLPLAHPHEGLTFLPAFLKIISKVFPLLICPFFAACFVRYCLPDLHALFLKCKDLAFYLWTVSLSIAIAITCKAIVHCQESFAHIAGIALVALVCCLFQFALGKKIGGFYGMRLEGGQGLGQKNTVFIIWLGYTFLNPVTSLAGGFYSVCHNIVNSYQLYKYRKHPPE